MERLADITFDREGAIAWLLRTRAEMDRLLAIDPDPGRLWSASAIEAIDACISALDVPGNLASRIRIHRRVIVQHSRRHGGRTDEMVPLRMVRASVLAHLQEAGTS